MAEGRRDRHGWISLDHYLAIHDRCLDDFRDYFVISDTLQYLPFDGEFRIEGRISCVHDLFIDVRKTLEYRAVDHKVRTIKYRYHAGKSAPVPRSIFRYDNAHGGYTELGHADEHHKHVYNIQSGKADFPPEWIGRARWPVLSEVIDELRRWWEATGQRIEWERLPRMDAPADD